MIIKKKVAWVEKLASCRNAETRCAMNEKYCKGRNRGYHVETGLVPLRPPENKLGKEKGGGAELNGCEE